MAYCRRFLLDVRICEFSCFLDGGIVVGNWDWWSGDEICFGGEDGFRFWLSYVIRIISENGERNRGLLFYWRVELENRLWFFGI